ncbi:MAG: hypothetical protein ACT6UL_00150 [Sphingopyxis sp.]|uniref:hypothetical protein n=1 Tax=Sphingopyxis sp. TaxID=1908224 RepID=UPI00403641B4
MIVRNAYLAGSRESARASANVERGQGEGDILPLSPDNHHTPAREGLIASERGNPFSNDAPDQPGTLVFIEFGRSGIAVPCLHFPFVHAQPDSQGS